MKRLAAALVLAFAFATPAWAEEVDVELVLAADGSGSIDPEELRLQRDGYADALTSPEVLAAIRSGPLGAVAIAFTEWGGETSHHLLVGWHVIRDAESAAVFAEKVRRAPKMASGHNSISGAIVFGARLMRENAEVGMRKVIDISADGPQIGGPPLAPARAAALAEGITINGLLIRPEQRAPWGLRFEGLEDFFKTEVIGGPGAFVRIVEGMPNFRTAVRQKLVQELAAVERPDRRAALAAPPR